MTYSFDDDVDYEPSEEPGRRFWVSIIVVAGLAIFGAVSAMLWRNYGTEVRAFPLFNSSTAQPAEASDKVAGLVKDLQASNQQSVGQLQAAIQLLTSQQVEIRSLSAEVTALIGKVDTLQRSVTLALPVSVPKQVALPLRKKPIVPNPVAANPTGAPPPAPPIQLGR